MENEVYMAFDYTFGLDLPELKKLISTEQFVKSEELMDLRYELALSEQEMAEIVGKSLQDYLLRRKAPTSRKAWDERSES